MNRDKKVKEKYVKGIANYAGLDEEDIKNSVAYENWEEWYEGYTDDPIGALVDSVKRRGERIKKYKKRLLKHVRGEYNYEKRSRTREHLIEDKKKMIKKNLKAMLHTTAQIYGIYLDHSEIKVDEEELIFVEAKEFRDEVREAIDIILGILGIFEVFRSGIKFGDEE